MQQLSPVMLPRPVVIILFSVYAMAKAKAVYHTAETGTQIQSVLVTDSETECGATTEQVDKHKTSNRDSRVLAACSVTVSFKLFHFSFHDQAVRGP